MDVPTMAKAAFDIDLEQYRQTHGLTWAEVAIRIGATGPRQAQAWATGAERPGSAEKLEAIERATDGQVTVNAMHRKRLEYERQHPRVVSVVPLRGAESASGDDGGAGVMSASRA